MKTSKDNLAASSFADIDARFEAWHREVHDAGKPAAALVRAPVDPTPEGLETEIWVKACLLTDGVRFDDSALAGVGEIYKEQSRWLFDWNLGEHHYYLPEELVLPMNTVVQVRENRDSRWLCTVEDGVMMLKRDGQFVIEAGHIPRPGYYAQEVSKDIIMRRVAPKRGQDCLVLNYAPFCMYWVTGDGCAFCNIVPNAKWTKDDLQLSKRTYAQIRDTTRAAFAEGCVRHILLTGGFLKRVVREDGKVTDREGDKILSVVAAMQEALGRDEIPVNVVRTAPEDLDTIEAHKQKGVYSVAYNLELWDPELFAHYCKGKATVQGRDHWLRALELAADVYGPGRVSTHFVAGFREPMNSLLSGVEWLSERGIASIPLIWSPVAGTSFAGERAPKAEWIIELTRKIVDSRLAHGVDTFEPAALPNDCVLCAVPTPIADELRLRELRAGLARVEPEQANHRPGGDLSVPRPKAASGPL